MSSHVPQGDGQHQQAPSFVPGQDGSGQGSCGPGDLWTPPELGLESGWIWSFFTTSILECGPLLAGLAQRQTMIDMLQRQQGYPTSSTIPGCGREGAVQDRDRLTTATKMDPKHASSWNLSHGPVILVNSADSAIG